MDLRGEHSFPAVMAGDLVVCSEAAEQLSKDAVYRAIEEKGSRWHHRLQLSSHLHGDRLLSAREHTVGTRVILEVGFDPRKRIPTRRLEEADAEVEEHVEERLELICDCDRMRRTL